jgi:hypothetical protein
MDDPVPEVLRHLSDPLAPPAARRAAEAWCGSDAAWGWCAAALLAAPPSPAAEPAQQLLVAQIMRHKVNTQGWALPPEQLPQLRDLLLRRVHAEPAAAAAGGAAGGGGPLLSELLLCLAGLFFLMPGWSDPAATALAAMTGGAAARFLQLLAEEAGGDLRRVHRGGPPGAGGRRWRR